MTENQQDSRLTAQNADADIRVIIIALGGRAASFIFAGTRLLLSIDTMWELLKLQRDLRHDTIQSLKTNWQCDDNFKIMSLGDIVILTMF